MDPRPFDALARALATARTRRDTLYGLAALVGAGGLLRAAGSAHAKDGPSGRAPAAQPDRRRRHKRVTGQISGGTPVPLGKYPFAVSLRMHGVGGDFLCSGSLIDPSHVLTAAHCTFDTGAGVPFPGSAYTVLVGQVDRTATNCAACRKRVTAVAVDPAWTGAGLDTIRPHDVAVLTLDTPVAVGIAQPIALVGSGGDDLDGAGQNAVAAGWGDTTPGGDASTVLIEAPLAVLDAAACLPDPAQLCTTVAGGRAICPGDSGGPLFVALPNPAATGKTRRGATARSVRRRHHHHHGGCPTLCPSGCAPDVNAVCCPPNDANPDGGSCPAGDTCCPPDAQFPGGSCAPSGTSCGGGATSGRFVQIGVTSGAPVGCPSADGTADVYTRLSNPAVNAFIRTALAG